MNPSAPGRLQNRPGRSFTTIGHGHLDKRAKRQRPPQPALNIIGRLAGSQSAFESIGRNRDAIKFCFHLFSREARGPKLLFFSISLPTRPSGINLKRSTTILICVGFQLWVAVWHFLAQLFKKACRILWREEEVFDWIGIL
jgi:hypothetical protein